MTEWPDFPIVHPPGSASLLSLSANHVADKLQRVANRLRSRFPRPYTAEPVFGVDTDGRWIVCGFQDEAGVRVPTEGVPFYLFEDGGDNVTPILVALDHGVCKPCGDLCEQTVVSPHEGLMVNIVVNNRQNVFSKIGECIQALLRRGRN